MFLKHFGRRLRLRSKRLLQRGHSFGFGTLGVHVWPQKEHLTGSREGPAKNKHLLVPLILLETVQAVIALLNFSANMQTVLPALGTNTLRQRLRH